MTKIEAHIRGREDVGNRHKIFIELDVTIDPADPRKDEHLGRDVHEAILWAFRAAHLRAETK